MLFRNPESNHRNLEHNSEHQDNEKICPSVHYLRSDGKWTIISNKISFFHNLEKSRIQEIESDTLSKEMRKEIKERGFELIPSKSFVGGGNIELETLIVKKTEKE